MEQYLLCEHIDDFVIMGKQHNYTGLKWLGEFMKLKRKRIILWDHKLNTLPVIDENQRLEYFVFRKDYDA